MKRCLYCYKPLTPQEVDFHASCSRKIFGQPTPPALPYTEQQMEELATQVIRSQMTVTGVQPKLSLDIVSGEAGHEAKRFTIVGLWGGYILKPPYAALSAIARSGRPDHAPGRDGQDQHRAS